MAKLATDRRLKPKGLLRPSGTLSPAALEFEQRADDILAGYNARKTAAGVCSPYEAKGAYFKRKAYQLIRDYLNTPGRSRTIKSLVRRWGREPRSPPFSQNPFFWGLLAIDPQADILTPGRLHIYSLQMLYAHRHDVPTQFLIGFLHQSGNPGDLSHKVTGNLREDWFVECSRKGTEKTDTPIVSGA